MLQTTLYMLEIVGYLLETALNMLEIVQYLIHTGLNHAGNSCYKQLYTCWK